MYKSKKKQLKMKEAHFGLSSDFTGRFWRFSPPKPKSIQTFLPGLRNKKGAGCATVISRVWMQLLVTHVYRKITLLLKRVQTF